MNPHHTHRPLTRTRSAAARAGRWLARTRAATLVSGRRLDDRGATAIEWAVFAVLAVTIALSVAAAITAAVNNRLPGIN
jgi:Flp pilus assembly pilin Flp